MAASYVGSRFSQMEHYFEIDSSVGLFCGCWIRTGVEHSVDDGQIRWFSLIAGVEDQGVLAEAPGSPVAEAPEGDALHACFVLEEDREYPRVRVGLGFEVLGGRRRRR